MTTTYDDTNPNPIENGVQQVFTEIRDSLALLMQSEVQDPDVRAAVLLGLDDAISNNWDDLMASFWQGVKEEIA